jgi:uncharacterized protein (DUF1501 family)
MPLTRREFLAGSGALAGAAVFGVAGPAFGATAVDPRTAARNRLVVIFLDGGNDGLNTVVPRGDVPGAARLSVYRRVRPTLAYKPSEVLALERDGDGAHQLGFNRQLKFVNSLYRDGRVAIVQGVDYPNHNYSHFASTDVWHTGDPAKGGGSGWLGRHLDRAGVGEGELRAVAIAPRVPLMLQGRVPAAAMTSVGAMRFSDGTSAHAEDRHAALAAMGVARAGDPLRSRMGATLRQSVDVVSDLRKTDAPTGGPTELANSLLTARTLLEQNLGVECVYVTQGNYDTHAAQLATHERLLGDLDTALEVFYLGTAGGNPVAGAAAMKPDVAARTLVMVVSEFGRRIGEAGRGLAVAGTDHGAAQPILLIGPAAGLTGGIHGEHPNMGTTAAPADNLAMTTDLRHLYQAVLQGWLANPDPLYTDARSGPLHGLFNLGSTAAAATGGKGRRGTVISSATLDAPGTTTSTLSGRSGSTRVAGEATARVVRGEGRAVHPVSVAAALAFNAFVAAIVLRSGRFRQAMADWRSPDTLS